jgi:flagellar basal body-associated protein FliL
MKKKSPFVITQSLQATLILLIFFIPMLVYAGTFYRCVNKSGNEILVDYPIDVQTCKPVQTDEETNNTRNKNKTAVPADGNITNITVKGNQIIVPATIVYNRREENVRLILDTGATSTTIHEEIADRLYIKLHKAKKAKGEVVGGGVINSSVVKIDAIKIGPHIIYNKYVFFVPYEGRATNFDGLLGMDVLGNFSYKIDFGKQIIIWE